MKRNILFGSVLAAALSVGLGAQSYPADQASPSRSQTSKSAGTTVTGCLQAASGSTSAPTGTSGSAAGASKADDFILANANTGSGASDPMASPRPSAAPSAAATSGSSSAMAGSQYKLTGGSKDELRRYVNSKVEITGKIEGSSGASASPDAAAGAASSASSKSSDKTLHVDSIKQIAPSCS